jgi:hypothetical protein
MGCGGLDFVSDIFDGAVDVVKDAAHDVIDFTADSAKFIVDATMTVTGSKWIDEQLTGGLMYNTFMGTIDNIANLNHGLTDGNWTQIRDSAMGIVTTAVAVAAIVAGAISGNYWLVAAGIIVLDAQHNEGELLRRSIAVVGDIEKAIIGTNYIEEYAVEIQILITLAAAAYAGAEGGAYLFDQLGVAQAVAQWKTQIAMIQNVVSAGYGSYQIYSAAQAIKDSQAYWEEKLREAEEYYRNQIAKAQAAKEQWFEMMTNPDLINRIQAGGDMFLLGAGHDLFSITSVAEPKYALGLIDTSDTEMDKLINNRYYLQSAGSDGFKIQ